MATRNLVIISDTHCVCRLGLCPPSGCELDDGAHYMPSKAQKKVWAHWREFWDEWIPRVTHGEPYVLVHNGDVIDGVHHGSVTQITHNLTYQRQLALEILLPMVRDPMCVAYYHIRGTEAHVGKSGAEEEQLARELGAAPNKEGQHARWELWIEVGPALVHITHHIGTSGAAAYESTALNRELVNAYTEAGRWNDRRPDFVVRSHRHRQAEIRLPTELGYGTAFITPGWQLKTPFVFRMAAKLSQPQFGGSIIRAGDEDVYSRHRTWTLARPKV